MTQLADLSPEKRAQLTADALFLADVLDQFLGQIEPPADVAMSALATVLASQFVRLRADASPTDDAQYLAGMRHIIERFEQLAATPREHINEVAGAVADNVAKH